LNNSGIGFSILGIDNSRIGYSGIIPELAIQELFQN
jgi:hypothetical protein